MAVEAGRVYLDVAFDARQVGQALNKSVGDAAKDAEKTLNQGLGKSAEKLGRTLTRTLTPAAAAVGLGFRQAFGEWDSGMDAIRAGTGATGRQLDQLGDTARRVTGQVNASFGQVATVMADLQTRTGATGAELETLTTRVLQLSDLGQDASVETLTRVFGDWSIEIADSEAALDRLYLTSQATGPTVDRLGQLIVQYGAPLRELGFGFDEAAALMGSFEQQGVNTEVVMSGLRQALTRFARDQRDPQEALQETIAQIQNAGSAAEANAVAFAAFGAEAGVDMARAIQEGRFSIDELVDTLDSSQDSIAQTAEDTTNLTDRLRRAYDAALATAGPIGEVGMAVAGIAAGAGPAIQGIGALATRMGGITSAASTAASFMTGPWGIAIAAASVGIGALWRNQQAANERLADANQLIDTNTGALLENAAQTRATQLQAEGLDQTAATFGISLATLTAATMDNADAQEEIRAATQATIWALEDARDTTEENSEEWLAWDDELQNARLGAERLTAEMASQSDALLAQQEATRAAIAAAAELEGGLSRQTEEWRELDTATRRSLAGAEEAEAAQGALAFALGFTEGQIDSLAGAFVGMVDPMDAWTTAQSDAEEQARQWAEEQVAAGQMSEDAVEGFVDEAIPTLNQWKDALLEQVQAQEAWADNMQTLAGRVSAETLEEIGRLGPEAAPLVADLATATDTELAEVEDLFRRRAETAGDEFVGQLIAAQGAAATAGAELGEAMHSGVTAELNAGLPGAAAITGDYADLLVRGTNPLLSALGQATIQLPSFSPFWHGGQVPGGYGTRDEIPAMLARGEVVESISAVRHWGAGNLLDLNARRVPPGWIIPGHTPGYFSGGFVTPGQVPGVPSFNPYRTPVSDAGRGTSTHARSAVAAFVERFGPFPRGLEFARANAGAPYLWGGVGPVGWDCSGWLGSIALAILGQNTQRRLFTSASIIDSGGGQYFSPGSGGAYTVGSVKGNPGHVAGTLLGVNVESTPGRTRVGAAARGANHPMFSHRYTFTGLYGGGLAGRDGKAIIPRGPGDAPYDLLNPAGARYVGDAKLAELTVPGGLLNPWVRDQGGPLRPGYTYNGTRSSELVIPPAGMAAGSAGAAAISAVIQGVLAGGSITDAIAEIGRLVQAWDDAAEAAEETARRDALWARRREEEAELARVIGEMEAATGQERADLAEDIAEQQQAVADAIIAIQEFDADQAARDLDEMARAAVDALTAQAEAAEAAAAAQQAAIDAALQAEEDALEQLNRLLDEREDILRRQAEATERHRQAVAEAEARYAEQMASLAARTAEQIARAEEAAAQAQARLIEQRTAQLTAAVAIGKDLTTRWGFTADQLIADITERTAAMVEWREALAALRARGVTQDVIAALGLDAGPEALGQIDQLTAATDEQLAAIVDAYADQAGEVAKTVQAEQNTASTALAQSIAQVQSDLAAQLLDIRTAHDEQAAELTAQHVAIIEELNVEQARLMVELTAEMATLGEEQGRTTAEAIAEGLRAGIPAIEAAVAAVRAAQAELVAAQGGIGGGAGNIGRPTSAPAAPASTWEGTLDRIASAVEATKTIHVDGEPLWRLTAARAAHARTVALVGGQMP